MSLKTALPGVHRSLYTAARHRDWLRGTGLMRGWLMRTSWDSGRIARLLSAHTWMVARSKGRSPRRRAQPVTSPVEAADLWCWDITDQYPILNLVIIVEVGGAGCCTRPGSPGEHVTKSRQPVSSKTKGERALLNGRVARWIRAPGVGATYPAAHSVQRIMSANN